MNKFYELIEGYSNQEIDKILLYCDNADLAYRYNSDEELSELDIKSIKKLVNNVKSKLRSIKKGTLVYIPINTLFPNLSKEDIIERSKVLKESYRNLLFYYFGKDLDKDALVLSSNKNILPSIAIDTINGVPYLEKNNPLDNKLRNYKLDNETKEEFIDRIKKTISLLEEKDKSLIYRKYGFNLEKQDYNYREFSLEERKYISNDILPKIVKYLKEDNNAKPKLVNINKFFNLSKYTNEDITLFIEFLNENDISKLQECFGKDYSGLVDVRTITKLSLSSIRDKLINVIVSTYKYGKDLEIKKLLLVKKIIKSSEYKRLSRYRTPEESLAILISIKAKDIFTNDELLELTGYSYKDSQIANYKRRKL